MSTSRSVIRKPAPLLTRYWPLFTFGAALLIVGGAVMLVLTTLPPPYACPRTIAGGYELMALKVRPSGAEYDCRYVKRGVR